MTKDNEDEDDIKRKSCDEILLLFPWMFLLSWVWLRQAVLEVLWVVVLCSCLYDDDDLIVQRKVIQNRLEKTDLKGKECICIVLGLYSNSIQNTRGEVRRTELN